MASRFLETQAYSLSFYTVSASKSAETSFFPLRSPLPWPAIPHIFGPAMISKPQAKDEKDLDQSDRAISLLFERHLALVLHSLLASFIIRIFRHLHLEIYTQIWPVLIILLRTHIFHILWALLQGFAFIFYGNLT